MYTKIQCDFGNIVCLSTVYLWIVMLHLVKIKVIFKVIT
jgi:hypothetical protein